MKKQMGPLTQVMYLAQGKKWKLALTREHNYYVIETQWTDKNPEYLVERTLRPTEGMAEKGKGHHITQEDCALQASEMVEWACQKAAILRKEHGDEPKISS